MRTFVKGTARVVINAGNSTVVGPLSSVPVFICVVIAVVIDSVSCTDSIFKAAYIVVAVIIIGSHIPILLAVFKFPYVNFSVCAGQDSHSGYKSVFLYTNILVPFFIGPGLNIVLT